MRLIVLISIFMLPSLSYSHSMYKCEGGEPAWTLSFDTKKNSFELGDGSAKTKKGIFKSNKALNNEPTITFFSGKIEKGPDVSFWLLPSSCTDSMVGEPTKWRGLFVKDGNPMTGCCKPVKSSNKVEISCTEAFCRDQTILKFKNIPIDSIRNIMISMNKKTFYGQCPNMGLAVKRLYTLREKKGSFDLIFNEFPKNGKISFRPCSDMNEQILKIKESSVKILQPNGPECPPTCKSLELEVKRSFINLILKN